VALQADHVHARVERCGEGAFTIGQSKIRRPQERQT
jgi:hypothetical protein